MWKPSPTQDRAPAPKKRIFDSARPRPRRRAVPCRSLRLVTPDTCAEQRPAILLACHGRIMRQTLTAILLRKGYDVTSCDDGRAAFRQLAGAHFDLVITSILMPNMDGLELIRSLRERPSPPPVMAVAEETDPMSPVYLRNAILFGATSTHTCPGDPTGLLAAVDWILSGRADVLQDLVW
jgi:CheY-like chemotaxis protein